MTDFAIEDYFYVWGCIIEFCLPHELIFHLLKWRGALKHRAIKISMERKL